MARSNTSTFRVIRPGLLTTVQDVGRIGYQRFGMPVSGAMDHLALLIANRLVGNPDKTAALEFTLQGPELFFEAGATCAITGGDFSPALDQIAVQNWKPFSIQAGSTLSFGKRKSGARGYIALSGGLDVPEILGSRSTHLRSQTGGFKGRALQKDDVLTYRNSSCSLTQYLDRTVTPDILSIYHSNARIRAVRGPHADLFASEALDNLQRHDFRLSPQSDRMGYRLLGIPLAHAKSPHILSEAVPLGAIQVPANQQPILLMADRQTTGGYPIIAVVISADIPLAAQLMPGDTLQFQMVTVKEAEEALRQQRTIVDKAIPPVG